MKNTLTILACLVLAGLASPQVTTADVAYGRALGAWTMPASTPMGSVQGCFLAVDGARLLEFQATLIAIRSGCLECTDGEIVGTLDDHVGPGPDYVVRGNYYGTTFTGGGGFRARILAPDGVTPMGSIEGTFSDPVTPTPQAGVFAGRFRVRL